MPEGIKKSRGRPIGSTTKPKITDFMTVSEIVEIVESAKNAAKEGNTEMQRYLMDQYFGKARQTVGVDGGEGLPIEVSLKEEKKKTLLDLLK